MVFSNSVSSFRPSLEVQQVAGRVRLLVSGLGCRGEGQTLQEAANDLIRQLLVVAMAFRSSGIGPFSSEVIPDLGMMEFLYELAEIAASGGDIRSRVFGNPSGDPFIP
jgi:hypothetical protein